MADQICYAILCVFSYVAAGQNKNNTNSTGNNLMDSTAAVAIGMNWLLWLRIDKL